MNIINNNENLIKLERIKYYKNLFPYEILSLWLNKNDYFEYNNFCKSKKYIEIFLKINGFFNLYSNNNNNDDDNDNIILNNNNNISLYNYIIGSKLKRREFLITKGDFLTKKLFFKSTSDLRKQISLLNPDKIDIGQIYSNYIIKNIKEYDNDIFLINNYDNNILIKHLIPLYIKGDNYNYILEIDNIRRIKNNKIKINSFNFLSCSCFIFYNYLLTFCNYIVLN